MYKNTGTKIISFSNVLTAIGYIISIILGIVLLFFGSEEEMPLLSFIGLIIAAVGCLFSWISNLLLAGFGELIDNSARIVALLESPKKELRSKEKSKKESSSPKTFIQLQNIIPNQEISLLMNQDCDLCNKTNTDVYTVKINENGSINCLYFCEKCFKNYNIEEFIK